MSSLPANIKRIGSDQKQPRKVETSYSKSMGAFCCHGNQNFDPICPKTLKQPFPHPNDATHKIWSRSANWLQRYSSSKVWNFCHSRSNNSKMSGLIRPKIERNRAFIPVLVTSNFDYKSVGAFCCHGNQSFRSYLPQVRKCKTFVIQRQVTPKGVIWSGPKSNSSFYACPGYQQLWWWFDQKWTS